MSFNIYFWGSVINIYRKFLFLITAGLVCNFQINFILTAREGGKIKFYYMRTYSCISCSSKRYSSYSC